MKKSKFFKVVSTAIILSTFFACAKDRTPAPEPSGASQRFIVLNEGNFTKGNTSAIAIMSDSTVTGDLFEAANNRVMGDIAQSMTKIGDKYFITVNNSGKIEVVNASDFKSVAIIEYKFSPYHIIQLDENRAVVSDVMAQKAWIINTKNYTVADSIDLGMTSQYMAITGGKIFFGCSQYPINSLKVSDVSNYKTVRTLNVRPVWSRRLLTDKNGKLWALTLDGAVCVDPATESVIKTLRPAPKGITIDPFMSWIDMRGDIVYVNCYKGSQNGLYRMSITDTEFPETPMFEIPGKILPYNIASTPDNTILVCDAIDWSQSGMIYEYNFSGAVVNSFNVGVCPNFIYFLK